MYYGRISDHEKVRLELEQHIETTKSLISRASPQGRDPGDLQTVGGDSFAGLASSDRPGPIEADAMVSAVLTIAAAMQDAIAATEFATLNAEAAPIRPELASLIERLREIDEALRVVAAMAKTDVPASPRRRSPRPARRMDTSSAAAPMYYGRSGNGSVTSPSAAFAAAGIIMAAWWRSALSAVVSISAIEWWIRDKLSPIANPRSNMPRKKRARRR